MTAATRVGLGLVVAALIVALAAPWLAPYDPQEQIDPAAGRLRPPLTRLAVVELADGQRLLADAVERTADGVRIVRAGERRRLDADSVANLTADGVSTWRFHLLGTDRFGRDVWSRLVYGAGVSLPIGLLATGLALTLGVALGALAGAAGGRVDRLVMRLVDAFLAFPRLFLVLALATLFEARMWLVILVLGATGWMGVCRLVRAEVLGVKRRDFVQAARALGKREPAILVEEILPHALTPALVDAALRVGDVVLIEAALSFLGQGVQPPTPSWGNMVAGGSDVLLSAWWVALFPGLAISLCVLGFNLLGDGLRERLDPRAPRPRPGGAAREATRPC